MVAQDRDQNRDQKFVKKLCELTQGDIIIWIEGNGGTFMAEHNSMVIQLTLDKNNQANLIVDGYLDITENDINHDGSLMELRDAVMANVRSQQPATPPPDREQELDYYIKKLDS
jgi:hypothetical protein